MKYQKCKLGLIIAFTMIALGTFNLVASLIDNETTHNMNRQSWNYLSEELSNKSEFLQNDGTKIILETKNNPTILVKKDGFTVIYDNDSKNYCWARQSEDGRLESTGYPVHLYDPNELGLEKDIRMSDAAAKRIYER